MQNEKQIQVLGWNPKKSKSHIKVFRHIFIGPAYQNTNIVFTFNIWCNSLMDFGP